MSPKIVKYCGVDSIEVKDRFGSSLIAVGKEALDSFHKDKMIDNLDYIEALVLLRKIKEK